MDITSEMQKKKPADQDFKLLTRSPKTSASTPEIDQAAHPAKISIDASSYAFQSEGHYWVRDTDLLWAPAVKAKKEGQKVFLQLLSGQTAEFSAEQFEKLEKCDARTLARDYENLVEMCEFSENAVLFQIRRRYENNKIYTNVGKLLISVNPYKNTVQTSEEVVERYKRLSIQQIGTPHIFNVASKAMKGLVLEKKNQSVIISGDSGSGKTECAKYIMFYFSKASGGDTGLEKKILRSNPLMEAFGNAKTVRNNNSSRFGKWMEICFDVKKVRILGGSIVQYLLEKSRVVRHAEGERNFHVFYMLLACLGAEDKAKYHLRESHYSYLGDGRNELQRDKAEWQNVLESFSTMGFCEQDKDFLFRVLSAIMNMGNVNFVVGKEDPCEVANEEQLRKVCEMLRIEYAVLRESLIAMNRRFGKQDIRSVLSCEKAVENRDLLAKEMYHKLFAWIVAKINSSLGSSAPRSPSVGILDIFGFEVFEKNLFEQLCINYANEKLQKHFTEYLFEQEQQEYRREKIRYDYVPFKDSTEVLAVFESKPTGIVSMLHSESAGPGGNDEGFLNGLNASFKIRNKNAVYNNRTNRSFLITHYANTVEYTVAGFVQSNKNKFCANLGLCLASSKVDLLSSLFREYSEKKNANSLYISKTSIIFQFEAQLSTLLGKIEKTSPHFVRCIKPNCEDTPDEFNSLLVMEQMRSSGLIVAVKVRSQGFPYRKRFKEFARTYKCCLPTEHQQEYDSKETMSERITFLIKNIMAELDPSEIQIGVKKVFYKASQMKLLEEAKRNRIVSIICFIQSSVRVSLVEKLMTRKKNHIHRLEESVRQRILKNIRSAQKEAIAIGVPPNHAIFDKCEQTINEIMLENRVEQVLGSSDFSKVTSLRTELKRICSGQNKFLSENMKTVLCRLDLHHVKLKKACHAKLLREVKGAISAKNLDQINKLIESINTDNTFDSEKILNNLVLCKKRIVHQNKKEQRRKMDQHRNEQSSPKIEEHPVAESINKKASYGIEADKPVANTKSIGDENAEFIGSIPARFKGDCVSREPGRTNSKSQRCYKMILKHTQILNRTKDHPEIMMDYRFDPKRIEFFFQSLEGTRPLENFSKIRMLKEHKTGVWKKFFRNETPGAFLKYQNDLIENSLLSVPVKGKESRFEYMSNAIESFKKICAFQKFPKDAESTHNILSFLQTGIETPEIRDELFAQLIKQTTDAPEEILISGLKMLYISLRSFQPSPEMVSTILSHLSLIVNNASIKNCKYNFTTSDNCCLCCLLLLENTEKRRANPPSKTEIAAITRNSYVRVSVFVSDGKVFRFKVYPLHLSFMTVNDVKLGVLYRVGIVKENEENEEKIADYFAIYSFTLPKHPLEVAKTTYIEDNCLLGDVFREIKFQVNEQSQNDSNLILKYKRLTRKDVFSANSLAWDRMIFAQTKFMYLHMEQVLPYAKDYSKLSALHLLADWREKQFEKAHLREWFKIGFIAPKCVLKALSEEQFLADLDLDLKSLSKKIGLDENRIERRYQAMKMFNKVFADNVFVEGDESIF